MKITITPPPSSTSILGELKPGSAFIPEGRTLNQAHTHGEVYIHGHVSDSGAHIKVTRLSDGYQSTWSRDERVQPVEATLNLALP